MIRKLYIIYIIYMRVLFKKIFQNNAVTHTHTHIQIYIYSHVYTSDVHMTIIHNL